MVHRIKKDLANPWYLIARGIKMYIFGYVCVEINFHNVDIQDEI